MLRKVDEQNHAKEEVVRVEASDQVLVKAQVVLFSAIPGIAAHESMACDGMPLRPATRMQGPSPLEETIWPLRTHAGHGRLLPAALAT